MRELKSVYPNAHVCECTCIYTRVDVEGVVKSSKKMVLCFSLGENIGDWTPWMEFPSLGTSKICLMSSTQPMALGISQLVGMTWLQPPGTLGLMRSMEVSLVYHVRVSLGLKLVCV